LGSATGSQLPPLLAGLAGVAGRRAVSTVGASGASVSGASVSGAGADGAVPAAAPALAGELARLDAAQAGAALEELVMARTALVLGHSSPVQAHLPFRELGLDSLTAIELRNQLNSATGLSLPTAVAFDYPTPAVLAVHLLGQLRPAVNRTEQDQLRDRIAAIPLSRLRAAGVMEILLGLIQEGGGPDGISGGSVRSDNAGDYDDIDEMDTESLIDIVLTDRDS
jgi:acyl carrier protein